MVRETNHLPEKMTEAEYHKRVVMPANENMIRIYDEACCCAVDELKKAAEILDKQPVPKDGRRIGFLDDNGKPAMITGMNPKTCMQCEYFIESTAMKYNVFRLRYVKIRVSSCIRLPKRVEVSNVRTACGEYKPKYKFGELRSMPIGKTTAEYDSILKKMRKGHAKYEVISYRGKRIDDMSKEELIEAVIIFHERYVDELKRQGVFK